MKRQIVLTKTAEQKLNKLFNYLEKNWSQKVKLRFIYKLEQSLNIIRQNPKAFPISEIKKGLHKCIVTRQTTIYFTFDEENIYFLTVFDNRQDPDKLQDEI